MVITHAYKHLHLANIIKQHMIVITINIIINPIYKKSVHFNPITVLSINLTIPQIKLKVRETKDLISVKLWVKLFNVPLN